MVPLVWLTMVTVPLMPVPVIVDPAVMTPDTALAVRFTPDAVPVNFRTTVWCVGRGLNRNSPNDHTAALFNTVGAIFSRISPTVLREGAYRLFFFSREEPRQHVHVAHPDGEAKFWIDPTVTVASQTGLSARQLSDANDIVQRHLERYEMPGSDTSVAEVTHISRHGFWLLLGEKELLVPFAEFPWFQNATIAQLSDVSWLTPDHLYWPQIDVDLSVESIEHPERFPLRSETRT